MTMNRNANRTGFALLEKVALACETTLHAEQEGRYGFLVLVVDLKDNAAAIATNGETDTLRDALRELLERIEREAPQILTVPIQ